MDRASFLALYAAVEGPLRRYATRVLNNASAADDVVQEAFVRALNSDRLPAEAGEARAYLFRIASNLMKDQWRRQQRDHARSDVDQETATSDDPSLRMDMGRLFSRMAFRERQLLWLAHVEGADHVAIASTLGVAAGSVKVLLHRARQKFGDLLRAGGYEPTRRPRDDT